MALKTLTDEQIRTWTREEKDRWWLANVYRGDMAQLTLRSAITGFLLGGILSATNLYVGAKTGWTLGVGLTSVILAFAMFKIFSSLRFGKDMTILENNCMQSIATAAGYMTGPLISGMAAYMWVENRTIDMWQMFAFNVVLSILGVLVAFPMKRRFINDEQQPFPEGRACGVVLDTLYTSEAAVGIFKAKALAVAAGFAGFISFISGENYMKLIQQKVLGLAEAWHLPHNIDAIYYWAVGKGWAPIPKLAGVDIRHLGLSVGLDFAMIGAGGLMGIKPAISMLVGMFINFVVVIPWMINIGEIKPRSAEAIAAGALPIDRVWALNTWALWWGISIMVVASLVALFAKPKVLLSAFTGLFSRRKSSEEDVVKHIELPIWISMVGIPIVGALGVWMMHDWFGVDWYLGAAAIPLIIVLTLIAANSTAMTGITPIGALSKIPQFMFGTIRPKHPGTNLMTAVMCVEVAGNASNLLMDIKPGYMLGAKPRQQAIGHVIGVISGALFSTPLFFALFLSDYKPGDSVQQAMAPAGGQFGFPSALQWKGISDLISQGLSSLPKTAQLSMLIAAVVGIVMESIRIATKGRFPLSPLAIGLGVVVPPESTVAMFLGAAFFWLMNLRYAERREAIGHKLWVATQEPICAGLIAGAALVGIGDVLVRVFVL